MWRVNSTENPPTNFDEKVEPTWHTWVRVKVRGRMRRSIVGRLSFCPASREDGDNELQNKQGITRIEP